MEFRSSHSTTIRLMKRCYILFTISIVLQEWKMSGSKTDKPLSFSSLVTERILIKVKRERSRTKSISMVTRSQRALNSKVTQQNIKIAPTHTKMRLTISRNTMTLMQFKRRAKKILHIKAWAQWVLLVGLVELETCNYLVAVVCQEYPEFQASVIYQVLGLAIKSFTISLTSFKLTWTSKTTATHWTKKATLNTTNTIILIE